MYKIYHSKKSDIYTVVVSDRKIAVYGQTEKMIGCGLITPVYAGAAYPTEEITMVYRDGSIKEFYGADELGAYLSDKYGRCYYCG